LPDAYNPLCPALAAALVTGHSGGTVPYSVDLLLPAPDLDAPFNDKGVAAASDDMTLIAAAF